MNMAPLLEKMVIFVVLMVLGYFCSRSGMLSRSFSRDASKLVINVFMTGTVINSVLGLENTMSGGEFFNIMLVLSISVVICYLMGALLGRLVPMSRERRPVYELLVSVTNNMFIALPVLSELYGPKAIFLCSLSCLPFNVALFTYGTSRLKQDGSAMRIRDVFSVPLVSTLVAVAIFVLRPPIPKIVSDLITTMASATMPLSMFVVGAALGSVSLLESFTDKKLYLMAFVRLLICPVLVWVVTGWLTTDPMLLGAGVIIAAAPTGIIVTSLSLQYERDAVFASKGVLLTTALSMVTIPLLVYILL